MGYHSYDRRYRMLSQCLDILPLFGHLAWPPLLICHHPHKWVGRSGLGEPGPLSWFLLDMRRTIDMLLTIMLSTICHVMSCHALISRLSVAPHLSAATMCPTKHFPEHSHPDIYHALFLLLKSPAHISSAHMIQHCWVGVKGSSHVSALSKTQPAPEMLPCAPSMCTKYVHQQHAPCMRTKYVHLV